MSMIQITIISIEGGGGGGGGGQHECFGVFLAKMAKDSLSKTIFK